MLPGSQHCGGQQGLTLCGSGDGEDVECPSLAMTTPVGLGPPDPAPPPSKAAELHPPTGLAAQPCLLHSPASSTAGLVHRLGSGLLPGSGGGPGCSLALIPLHWVPACATEQPPGSLIPCSASLHHWLGSFSQRVTTQELVIKYSPQTFS